MRAASLLLVAVCAAGCGGTPLSPQVEAGASGAGGAIAPGAAGSTAGTGGATAGTGGAAAGTGGAAAGMGGATAGAVGAIGVAASSGSDGGAGAAGTAGGAKPGPGCGKPLPARQPPTIPGKPNGYMAYAVMGTGATLLPGEPASSKAGLRTFWVRVPADYDPNHPYRVVYIGQGCGGYNVANTSTMPLYSEALGGTEEAIYVALDIPTDMANQDCYDDMSGTSSQEWEAFALFHAIVDFDYCVDNDRVFVSGYSTGGHLANMWGCYFAGDGQDPWDGVPGGVSGAPATPRKFAPQYHVRGQASVAGGEPSNDPPCNGPVAAIWIHDLMDSNPYTASHDVALPRVLKMNGCYDGANQKTAPWHEDVMGKGVCVKYTDCPAAYPVVFCTTVGQGHADQHDIAIPGFKLFFDEASAP